MGEDEAAADAALERRAQALADEGRRPYVIHSAPGHPPLGGLGYVLAAEEVMVQARGLGIGFDAVVCASGSALTHAGLLVGSRALGEAVPVYGICVRRDARRQGDRVAQVAAELAGMIERSAAFDAGDVEVSDAVHAPGYGRLNDAVREAMALAARHEALLLDPVYTGKAMAGLVALRACGPHCRGQPRALRAYRRIAGDLRLRGPARLLALGGALDAGGLTTPRASVTDGALRCRPRPWPLPGPTPGMPGPRAVAGMRSLVMRQQRSGASAWRSKTGTSVLLSSSRAISIGRPTAAPMPCTAALDQHAVEAEARGPATSPASTGPAA